MSKTHYFFKNPWIKRCAALFDALLPKASSNPVHKVRRLLVSNIAHLGDVVLSTSVLPVLKEAFPEAEIGFLSSSWTKSFLIDHPLLHHLHTVDHWKLNRSPLSWKEKIRIYRETKREALCQIRERCYDVAIDLYCYFPNSIPLLWKAGIPVRIGYTSGCFGPLLTHPVHWTEKRHMIYSYLSLLSTVSIDPKILSKARPFFGKERAPQFALPQRYCIFHMGAGCPKKEWKIEQWKELASLAVASGWEIILTGKGKREWENIEPICREVPHTFNSANCLDSAELLFVCRLADLLISVDTALVHIADALSVKSVVLSEQSSNALWKPLFTPSIGLDFKDLSARTVFEAALSLLNISEAAGAHNGGNSDSGSESGIE